MNPLEAAFPKLAQAGYAITSPATTDYNCIAWAAQDVSAWWWPDPHGQYFWPIGVPRETSLQAFELAYEELGFTRCADGTVEQGQEKIAIYADSQGLPTHAARLLLSGRWTSKLGPYVDIEHGTVQGVEGPDYGTVAFFMRRPLP